MRLLGGERMALIALCIAAAAWREPIAVLAADVPVTKTADTDDGTCDTDCSLREAVDTANADDRILIPAGVFTLTGGEIEIDKALTLQGAGAHDTIIQAAATPGTAGHRIFNVTATNSNLALIDLTIRHGAIIAGAGSGGAISWSGGTGRLVITRCKVVLNQVNADGPMNGGAGSGGAIFFSSSGAFTITDSTVADNQVSANGASTVGGAGSGGGIFSSSTSTSFIRSTLARNRVSTVGPLGGGAASGGGIFCGALTLTNSTVSDNEAVCTGACSGGGIFCGATDVLSSTIADNRTLRSGIPLSGLNATFMARNSLFARNGDCVSLTSDGYNLVDVGCGIVPGPGDKIGSDASPIDPLIGPLADNGGKTETRALLPLSPAIDMGNPAGCEDESAAPLLTDQRGLPRAFDGNGDGVAVCDIGAFELEFVHYLPAPILSWLGLMALGAGLAGLGVRRLDRARNRSRTAVAPIA